MGASIAKAANVVMEGLVACAAMVGLQFWAFAEAVGRKEALGAAREGAGEGPLLAINIGERDGDRWCVLVKNLFSW